MLPTDFPNWHTVRYHWDAWKRDGTWARINTALRERALRWVVERTFAWLGRNRRLSRDFERCEATSEAFIYAASCHLLMKRLAPVTE